MKKSKFLALTTMAALCVSSLVGCGKTNYTANNKEYVIGLSGPLTGPAAVYGTAVKNSAEMAVEEINAAGGLNGINFKLIMKDDKHEATNVATCYSSMLEEGMQVSLGTVTTNPGLEFANLSAEDNVFFLTPSASGNDIPKNDNGFQMCFADGNQGVAAAQYVNENYAGQTIGIFYKSDDSYSNGIYKQFKENLDSSIQTIDALFTDANTTDFSTQISTLKECSFIFMPIYYTPASIFMTQAKDQIAADAIYYGCDGFDGIESAEGFDITAIPQEVTMLSHFNSKATEGKAAEFIQKYTEKYDASTLNQFGAATYDCVYAIYNAMQECINEGKEIPVTISASDLCDILKAKFTGDFVFTGITGEEGKSISWDKNGYVEKAAVKYVIKEATK